MSVDHIRYDILAQEALRAVVRRVLADVARTGTLPGEHHFYISFDTQGPGVRVSPRLLAQYPEEMTIILQHQFWDLTVSDQGFEVGLSFNGIPERLIVPFAAIKGFFDPSVQFGLQFQPMPDEAGGEGTEGQPPATVATKVQPAAAVEPARPPEAATPEAAEPAGEAKSDKPAGGGEVVRLDRFRKK